MALKPSQLPGNLIFAACEMFFQRTEDGGRMYTVQSISDWLNTKGYAVTREGVYRIVGIGIDRGYVRLCPPTHHRLRERLLSRYPKAGDVRVVDVRPPSDVVDQLAGAAADLIVELIRRIGAERNPPGTPADKRVGVHMGIGGGGTSLLVARRLSQRLRAEFDLPPLTIHALTAGFDIHRPLTAPSAFLSLFDKLRDVKSVGLFSAPVVKSKHFDHQKTLPGIDKAVELAEKIDIVVTSLAQADDKHGLLNLFFRDHGEDGERQRLLDRGHRGDVLWQPFDDNGPMEGASIRAFTLFDIPRLVEMADRSDKHVIAIAGPCVECGRTKEKALLPLLRNRNLRVFNHLVTDAATVEELVPAEEDAA